MLGMSLKRVILTLLAILALAAPVGLALAQDDGGDTPQSEVVSPELQTEAENTYEQALAICQAATESDSDSVEPPAACDRVLGGNILGADSSEGE